MIKIHNFLFPKGYFFYLFDPNGGLWIKSEKKANIYTIGVSSLIAEKLETIKSFSISHTNFEIKKNDIFLQLEGNKYEMNFYSPFYAKIKEINPLLEELPDLTQNSIYYEHWMVKVIVPDFDIANWTLPNTNVFSKVISTILKADKQLREKCCPELSDSLIVRRKYPID